MIRNWVLKSLKTLKKIQKKIFFDGSPGPKPEFK